MIRLLPRTPRGTWLLAGAVWLAGCGVLWWTVPYRPRVTWPTDKRAVIHGFIPGTSVLLTSSPWPGGSVGPTGTKPSRAGGRPPAGINPAARLFLDVDMA